MRYPTETEVKNFVEISDGHDVAITAQQGLLWGKITEVGEDSFKVDGVEVEYADVTRYSD